jgi:pimeloyl-ACP methyl ester carboxylesterase
VPDQADNKGIMVLVWLGFLAFWGVVFGSLALVLLAALLVGMHKGYASWVWRAFPPTGERLPFEGGSLRVARRGHGPGVVLVHGMNGTAHDFPDELLDDLARDHTVLALDRPGHAGSTRTRAALDLDANARAVRAVLATLGGERAVLVGHSYGAAIALRVALDQPERVAGVVLLAPCTQVDNRNRAYTRLPIGPGPLRRALIWLAAVPVGAVTVRRARRDAWHPEPVPAGPFFSRAHALVPGQVEAALENFHTLPEDLARLFEDLPRLAPPLAVLAGAEDLVTPWRIHAAWLPARVPGATLRVLDRVGHWLPRQRPGEVANAVRALGVRAG